MRRAVLIAFVAFIAVQASGATLNAPHLRRIVSSSAEGDSPETIVERAIQAADQSFTLDELTAVVRMATACCTNSAAVSQSLTALLRENHAVYAGKLPTEASQFRGFLIASLGAFPPNDDLYSYVKTEFLFGGHAFGIAAAAVAARNFPQKADELVPLMEPFLGHTYEDQWVDLSTPELKYPLENPTRARHEIVRTLATYGARACRSLPRLDEVRAGKLGSQAADDVLHREATMAAEHIRRVSPLCRRESTPTGATAAGLRVIEKRQRKPFPTHSLKLVDQDGQPLEFRALRGSPFALTFFYSRCTNTMKCVMTVRRLSALVTECAKDDLTDRVGIYGMTYDPQFDGPSILKKYGSMHGMKFSRNVRLVKTAGELGTAFREQLQLRVSYGAGSVNQHGIQLFVFDKEGRLAATHDNELWSPLDVKNCLARLAAE
jgi:cytochrome oxidase Cu insertion factor (SCO1/SenC/PrrC family)